MAKLRSLVQFVLHILFVLTLASKGAVLYRNIVLLTIVILTKK